MAQRRKWTDDMLAVEAKKYSNAKEFQENNRGAYQLCCERGIREEVTKHFEKLSSGYTFTQWAGDAKKGYLYIACFEHTYEKEFFCKVGITKRGVNTRFSNIAPYQLNTYRVWTGSPIEVWDTERLLVRKFKDKAYTPKYSFHGKTECFDMSALAGLTAGAENVLT